MTVWLPATSPNSTPVPRVAPAEVPVPARDADAAHAAVAHAGPARPGRWTSWCGRTCPA